MKTNLNFIFYLLLPLWLIVACQPDNSEELTELKEKQQNDSILLAEFTREMDEINNALDSVAKMEAELQAQDEMKKKDALEKIQQINQLLHNRGEKINELEQELENLEAQYNKTLARGYVTEGQERIRIKSKYYEELEQRIKELESENISLKQILEEKEKELVEKDDVISKIKKEREKQARELKKLEEDILNKKVALDDAKKEAAETYYEMAHDMRRLADETSGLLNRKKKTKMTKLAYEYYKKSYEMGYLKAKSKIELMETDKSYAKFLE